MLKTPQAAVNHTSTVPNRRLRALRLDWLGQTAASLLWITSVFSYGIDSAGDALQLAAATAWLIANLASLSRSGED